MISVSLQAYVPGGLGYMLWNEREITISGLGPSCFAFWAVLGQLGPFRGYFGGFREVKDQHKARMNWLDL